MDAPNLRLNCWIFGQDNNSVFEVEISPSESVAALKRAISINAPPVWGTAIKEASLRLYKVHDPVAPEDLALENIDHDPMPAAALLSEIFAQPPPGVVHVAIDAPSMAPIRKLERFRAAVWGNENVFIEPVPGSHLTCLNFGEHRAAVRVFCKALWRSKLLVFAGYRTAMETFTRPEGPHTNGACIIGQAGIGKSCFIAYAVTERLRKKQPVAVQVPSKTSYYLFSDKGVTHHACGDQDPLGSFRSAVWAFSDSDEYNRIPTPAFTQNDALLADSERENSHMRIFQTTSPDQERWKGWTRRAMIKRYTLNLPSLEEMQAFAIAHGYDPERVKPVVDKWGPIPRLFLRIQRDSEEDVLDATSLSDF